MINASHINRKIAIFYIIYIIYIYYLLYLYYIFVFFSKILSVSAQKNVLPSDSTLFIKCRVINTYVFSSFVEIIHPHDTNASKNAEQERCRLIRPFTASNRLCVRLREVSDWG